MSKEIKMNQKGFREERTKFSADTQNLKTVKAYVNKQGTRMTGIDRMERCVQEYNKTLQVLNALLDQTNQAMSNMENLLVQTDNAVAAKVFRGEKHG